MVRYCRWDGCRCYLSSCDSCGLFEVTLCVRHMNPDGRLLSRMYRPIYVSIFSRGR